MTTELEQQFFEVFGIEPKKQGYCDWQSDCPYSDIKCGDDCPYWKYKNELKYPEITDRKLLEMICINSQKGGIEIFNRKNTEELKNSILQYCIDRLGYALNKEQYKTKIQQLFKEEE